MHFHHSTNYTLYQLFLKTLLIRQNTKRKLFKYQLCYLHRPVWTGSVQVHTHESGFVRAPIQVLCKGVCAGGLIHLDMYKSNFLVK